MTRPTGIEWATGDPIEKMRVYRLAKELRKSCWDDAEVTIRHPITSEIAGQLYASVGSIAVNISEGYSRSSGKDRARIFEYALGSARESRDWYESIEPILKTEIAIARRDTLAEIIKMLLAIIPRERVRTGLSK